MSRQLTTCSTADLKVWSMALALSAALAGCQRTREPATPPPSRPVVHEGIYRTAFQSGELELTAEVLDDDLVRLSLSLGPGSAEADRRDSPFIVQREYPGPPRVTRAGNVLETAELRISVDEKTLAVTVAELAGGARRTLTTVSPVIDAGELSGITLTRSGARNVYGLGEQFVELGEPDGTWIGRRRTPGNVYGNRMVPYHGGAVGNTQIPIMYALGAGKDGYALFMDHAEAITWDFTSDPWRVSLDAPRIRWYVLAGPDLPDLRADYMELVGRPLVPPKKMFGLWVSEYGFRDWDDVMTKLTSLREKRFPLDGFVLDLFWFGGIENESPASSMGSLTWDTDRFPAPEQRIKALAKQGVGIMVIEESYVSRDLDEFALLRHAGYLVRKCSHCDPVTFSSWWGAGGMIDWSSSVGAAFWHDYRRAHLIRDGVIGHWTDLGEPETFSADAWYQGIDGSHDHAAVANLYNFLWLRGIRDGYQRQRTERRPFMLSRSGGPGIQRFGAAMWSGDIASNLASLRSHMNVQMHMSLAGIDYFGADIGGFKRHAVQGDVDEMYTQWLACGAAVDVPVRPHTNNLEQIHETAPDRVGDVESNRSSIRLRYQLAPYLYTLAHRAYREGTPVFPPPVFYYQDDPQVREIGSQKMIGRDLMVGLVARHGATHRDVYLPRGTWFDYRTGERIRSCGETVEQVPLRVDGRFVLPLYARAGAIIPEMPVSDATLDITGLRTGDAGPPPLVLRIFPDRQRSERMLFGDDGRTIAYLAGEVRQTRIEQHSSDERLSVTVHHAEGSYAGAPTHRHVNVIFVCPGSEVTGATVNGAPIPRVGNPGALQKAERGWCRTAENVITVRSGDLPVKETRTVSIQLVR